MSLDLEVLATSFERVQKESGGTRAFGLRFYERLFEKYPSVKPLFNTPAEEQHKKLVASLKVILKLASQPEQFVPYLRAMAVRHIDYGTKAEHYPAVKENLLAVLQEHLSKEGKWTEAMQQNWSAALDAVNAVMMETTENPEAYADELKAAGFQPDGSRQDQKAPWELAGVS